MIFLPGLLFCLLLGEWANGDYTVNQDEERNSIEYADKLSHRIQEYQPTWKSLDSRPLPVWYDEAKFGIFIHWGVFSVPSFGSEWFWKSWKSEITSSRYRDFMRQRYPPNFTYQDFAKEFTAEFFNATEWSEIFANSGAKYVVLTSKHHEGYTLWPSKHAFSWNSKDVGPNRDLVGELASAIRANTNIRFGLYHSLYEWFNPLWMADLKNNFTTDDFVRSKTMPELEELVHLYKPEVIWSDGEWDAPDTYWKSKEFLAWLFNASPVKETVVVNDRWGHEIACHHGDFYTCADRYNPGVLQKHKWENALTVDRQSWGYRRNARLADYLTLQELVKELVTTVSCGGNMLLNVGPTKDGIIEPIQQERLRDLGKWLSVNGEGIYKSKPWRYQNDTLNGNVWFTTNKAENIVYGFILEWPEENLLRLGAPRMEASNQVILLGQNPAKPLKWEGVGETVEIHLPAAAHRGQPAWTLVFS